MEKPIEIPIVDESPSVRCCSLHRISNLLCTKACVMMLLVGCFGALASAAFLAGRLSGLQTAPTLPPELIRASATHAGPDMAVATAQIDEETEGVFFLDFKTGDLTCWMYYPRFMRYGAKYMCNVTEQLPATKNAEYLLVTGLMTSPPAASNNRLANSIVYVVDPKSGLFASYSVATNRALESAGQPQVGPIVFLGGGEVRAPSAGSAKRTIPNGANPDANAAAGANAVGGNAVQPNANPAQRNNRK